MSRTRYDAVRPWDRQPCDSDRTYQAFLLFVSLGFERSLNDVKTYTPAEAHSIAYACNWRERAEAWDAFYGMSILQTAIGEAEYKANRRNARWRAARVADKRLELAERGLDAQLAFDNPLLSIGDIARLAGVKSEGDDTLEATDTEESKTDYGRLTDEELGQAKVLAVKAGA